jgi:acetoin:2,6-dichlorophenolindophenol oxidoreductase subunit beta
MAKLRMNQAITLAIAEEMERDDHVVTFGEDIAEAEGPFKTSEGLLKRFGPKRVRDTPISEMGFVGCAVGAAVTGLRPIVEIMFVEFLGVALDQLVTEAATMHFLSGGKLNAPLTLRASVGAGLGFGCQHSQTLERWLLGTPGLKVAVASGARSAYGLTKAAIRDDDPVVVLEPRSLYGRREDFEANEQAITELGKGEVLKEGSDVTIVALGQTVASALDAAESSEWSGEVIDLRTIQPWDRDLVAASVAKTGKLVTVEENQFTGGWGSDIVSYVASQCYGDLKAPPLRVTAPDVHVPYGTVLEQRYLPGPDYVGEQVSALLKTGSTPSPWWEGVL